MAPVLPESLPFERAAINRVTFGARDTDVVYAKSIGWPAWVKEQLDAPPGDDPALAAHIQAQRWRIQYPAGTRTGETWPATDELRPLTFLTAPPEKFWAISYNVGFAVNYAERERIYTEFTAANLIRNTHAKWQLREFMADFWFNHFNIGSEKNAFATAMLIAYDRDVIRPNVFGNFRKFLEGIATSASMLIYLDNFISSAGTPNENYARELLELHTLGGGAYLGQVDPFAGNPAPGPDQIGVNARGFTDADIIQASRAFSGWTLDTGQAFGGVQLKNNGSFLYSPFQHNTTARKFMGVDLVPLTADLAQGRAILDIVADHPATASFICTKLCRRIFGDAPPAAVINRATTAWMAHRQAPDQIRKVLEAILLAGNEIGTAAPAKVRRPYERMVALFRTTDMTVSAIEYLYLLLSPVGDLAGAWQGPNGRPDINAYWLSSGALLAAVNLVFRPDYWPEIKVALIDQMPEQTTRSVVLAVDYWIDRMVGAQPDSATYDGLIKAAQALGLSSLTTDGRAAYEEIMRRVVGLIASSATFAHR